MQKMLIKNRQRSSSWSAHNLPIRLILIRRNSQRIAKCCSRLEKYEEHFKSTFIFSPFSDRRENVTFNHSFYCFHFSSCWESWNWMRCDYDRCHLLTTVGFVTPCQFASFWETQKQKSMLLVDSTRIIPATKERKKVDKHRELTSQRSRKTKLNFFSCWTCSSRRKTFLVTPSMSFTI